RRRRRAPPRPPPDPPARGGAVITAAAFLAMAAVGALARAEAGRRWNRPDGFPHGTLAVNVTGSFALGLLVDATPPFATVVGVGATAAVGGLAGAEAGRRWNRPGGFPHGTLAVNVTGSFALGLLVDATPPFATVVGVGALGAYTTFPSFARDAVALAEAGRRR